MTRDEIEQLEEAFGVALPTAYRMAISEGSYVLAGDSQNLVTSAEELRTLNAGLRAEETPWGFYWEEYFWCIGEDGAGGYYFLDTRDLMSTVYYLDHEDCPATLGDRERLHPRSLEEFISDAREIDEDFAEWEDQMRQKVANRKWWQFWIPRQWP